MIFIISFLLAIVQAELPLYLAVFATDNHQTQVQLRLLVNEVVNELIQQYPQDQTLKTMKLDLLHNNFYKSPINLHVTTFFIGDKPNAEDSEYFKKFTPNVKQDLRVHAIALLPKKVIACIMARQDYTVPIENQFPHMTTLLGTWIAVDSNILMTNLFGEDMPLESIYDSLFEQHPTNLYYNAKISGKGQDNLQAYVMSFAEKRIFAGETKYGYE